MDEKISEVAKLVETWRKRANAINDPMLAYSSGLRQFADELEAALLATAPPEQAARPTVSGASPVCLDCNKAGLRNCSHFDNCDGTWVYKPDSPQAASDGALDVIKDKIHEYLGSDSMYDCWSEVFPLLAAHDQKVRAEATLAEHQSHVEFESELYATLVDPVAEGSIKEAEMRKQLLEQARWYRQRVHDLEDFTALLKAAQQGLETWAARPGNHRWKRIDGTPIPNDLLVNIVEAIRAPAASKPEAEAEK